VMPGAHRDPFLVERGPHILRPVRVQHERHDKLSRDRLRPTRMRRRFAPRMDASSAVDSGWLGSLLSVSLASKGTGDSRGITSAASTITDTTSM
jgi:hypothetical protein